MGVSWCWGDSECDSQMIGGNYDCTDIPPSSCKVSKTTLGLLVFSIILHCSDVGFDIYVAYSYLTAEKYSYGAWSIAFIIIPSVVLATISIRMYLDDLHKRRIQFVGTLLRVILCILGLPIQSATLIRTIDSLYFALRCRKSGKQINLTECHKSEKQINLTEKRRELMKYYYIRMLNEDSDAAFLKVFEAYLESAPQQVLQMTLLIVEYMQGSYVHSTRQILSIIFGFISMAMCMSNYNRCIRLDQKNKRNVSLPGLTVHFLWHLFFTVSRILTISALASLYTFWTCVATGIHWFLISIWLCISSTHGFCPSKFLGVLFAFIVGAIYIFNFLSLNDGPKKYYYVFYYLLIFIENTAAIAIWGVESSFKNWVYYFFTVLSPACFVLGLVFMLVYYKFLHPTLSR